jgi:hypothetical protein
MTKYVVLGFALAIAGGLHAAVVDEAQVGPLQKQGRSSVASHAAAKPVAAQGQSYIEAVYQRKLGRNTPMEEARLNEEKASTAYRAAPASASQPYIDQYMRAKIGRVTGR